MGAIPGSNSKLHNKYGIRIYSRRISRSQKTALFNRLLGFEHTDSQWSEFRQKITDLTTDSINWQFFQSIVESVPDPRMATLFNECLRNCTDRKGLLLTLKDKEDDQVVLQVSYKKQYQPDPWARIREVVVKNCKQVNGRLKKGNEIKEELSIVLKRDPSKSLFFMLQTDHGDVCYSVPAKCLPPPPSCLDHPAGRLHTKYWLARRPA